MDTKIVPFQCVFFWLQLLNAASCSCFAVSVFQENGTSKKRAHHKQQLRGGTVRFSLFLSGKSRYNQEKRTAL